MTALTLPGLSLNLPRDEGDEFLSSLRAPGLIYCKGMTKKGLVGRAIFSPCETYRYFLSREWGGPRSFENACAFVCLNPSTATHEADDATIRKCIKFAHTWGFDAYWMLNIFAFRETDPFILRSHPEPVGIANNAALSLFTTRASRVVCAWGNHGKVRNRAREAARFIVNSNPLCFKLTKEKQPEHPLYQPDDAVLIPWART